jgi:hypothetical protein
VSRYNSLYCAGGSDIEVLRVLMGRLDEGVDDKGDDNNVVVERSQLE